jgi:hypothetical protein
VAPFYHKGENNYEILGQFYEWICQRLDIVHCYGEAELHYFRSWIPANLSFWNTGTGMAKEAT